MLFVAKLSILCVLSAPLAAASAQELAISPVTRVVELLQGLAKQVEKEGKVEEGLYEDFVCWGKSIIQQKTASNAAARSRIARLLLKAGWCRYQNCTFCTKSCLLR